MRLISSPATLAKGICLSPLIIKSAWISSEIMMTSYLAQSRTISFKVASSHT